MDKLRKIIDETGEEYDRELANALNRLDNYTVTPPSPAAAASLLASLKPHLRPKESLPAEPAERIPLLLHLLRLQIHLLSGRLTLLAAVILLAGVALISWLEWNVLQFLISAAPLLAIATFAYEYRSRMYGVSELEASCPYTPVQLATARLVVALGYNIILCLAATFFVTWNSQLLLWRVILEWMSPLFLVVGTAMTVSLWTGVMGGCLAGGVVWGLQMVMTDGGTLFRLFIHHDSLADCSSLALGLALLAISFLLLRSPAILQRWLGEGS